MQVAATIDVHHVPVSVAFGEEALWVVTLAERALRIEPDNPLVWIEMGRMRLASGDAPQAENMGRRALALAAGAPREQSGAWRLIADALRARGRNIAAHEAARRAEALATP